MNTITVRQFLDLVNETMRVGIPSDQLAVVGEVSDFRVSQQKWVSFDLKDEEEQAVLKCFTTVWQLKVPLEDGMKVQVNGYPKIYERFGQFKMNVQQVELVGEGALQKAYELLKKKLHKEGLFDPTRKRSLVRFPNKIGLITSREAAAYGDFLRILNNRWGGVAVDHTHVHVQGRNAVPEILGAFQYFNALEDAERPDVIVLTRGGGGLEDLHAFNDEQVARAVFSSKIPVVCGVGHERDESLCDYVADVRASTPSNAAELVVPDRREVLYELQAMTERMENRLTRTLDEKQNVVDSAARVMVHIMQEQSIRLEGSVHRLVLGMEGWIGSLRARLESSERLLKNLDPTQVLKRGYAIVTKAGKAVKDAGRLEPGDTIAVQFAKGQVDADVK